MKKIFISLVTTFIVISAHSQDTIYKKDGTVIYCTLTEIAENAIYYRHYPLTIFETQNPNYTNKIRNGKIKKLIREEKLAPTTTNNRNDLDNNYYYLQDIKLPVNKKTNKIEYTKELKFQNLKRNEIYEKFIQWAYSFYTAKQIKDHNKEDGIVSIVASSRYIYNNSESNFNYKMVAIINDNSCKIIMTDIEMHRENLEVFYVKYKFSRSEKLFNAFNSIKDNILNVLSKIPGDQ